MRKILLPALAAIAVGCATTGESNRAPGALEVMKRSFKTHGIASVERLDQDETQALCSASGGKVTPEAAKRIQAINLAAVKYPSDGRYLGDWREGEKIAQSGRGFQFTDDAKTVAGGNCYACHQLSPQELSYGTIGPSLYQYGKRRGAGDETTQYTWAKIYNAQAFAACSSMPRFGHSRILTEDQIRDVVALLLDPNSPVNK